LRDTRENPEAAICGRSRQAASRHLTWLAGDHRQQGVANCDFRAPAAIDEPAARVRKRSMKAKCQNQPLSSVAACLVYAAVVLRAALRSRPINACR